MSEIPVVPKLPSKLYLEDKERVADKSGNIWEYNSEKNEFLYKGQVTTLPEVGYDVDGLVTPDIYQTLALIQELIDQGVQFGKFKLKTDVENPYFFYFHSSDDLIKFDPEAQDVLRMEVDLARLYQKLLKQCCIGPKGRKGETGDPGKAGRAAANEVFIKVPFEDDRVIISANVPSPINTPISLRFFDAAKIEVAEFLVDTSTNEVTFVLSDGISIEESSLDLTYDKTTTRLTADIRFIGSDVSGWFYKARQRGADGDSGPDGNPFLEIITDLLPDPTLHSTRAIVSMRKSGTNNICYLEKDVFDRITVSRLSATAGALPPSDLLKSYFVAAEVTTRNSKDIGYCNIANRLTDIKIPDLELPSWTPQPGCGQRNRWSAFRFNWYDFADAPNIFKIIPTSRPPENCCEQDFFHCPNIGDQPCGVKGPGGRPPEIEMPKKIINDCICECENPIEFELMSGGYIFDSLDTTTEAFTNGAATVVAVDSVIDGSSDRFAVDIILNRAIRVEVKVMEKPEVCGGAKKEQESCAFKSGNKVHTTSTIQDVSGGVIFTSPQLVEIENFPGKIEYLLDTQSYMSDGETNKVTSRVRVVAVVNDTFLSLCRGYRVSIAAFPI